MFLNSFCDIAATLKRAHKIAKRALATSNVDSSGSADEDSDSAPREKRPRNKTSLEEFPDYSDNDTDSKFVYIKHKVYMVMFFKVNHRI
jgi:hypothetical protein